MANDLYTPAQVASVAAKLLSDNIAVAKMVNRDFSSDFVPGVGTVVNVRIPAALLADLRSADSTQPVNLQDLTEAFYPVTMDRLVVSAVALTEGDMSLRIEDFASRVLAHQMDAVADQIENLTVNALKSAPLAQTAFDIANPLPGITGLRKELRESKIPATGLKLICGTDVYAGLLDSGVLDSPVNQPTESLADGVVMRLRGFDVIESTRLDSTDLIVFHRDSVVLATRAPQIPQGAAFAATVEDEGFAMRYLRDYDSYRMRDRSSVAALAGAALIPARVVERDYDAATASVVEKPSALRVEVAI